MQKMNGEDSSVPGLSRRKRASSNQNCVIPEENEEEKSIEENESHMNRDTQTHKSKLENIREEHADDRDPTLYSDTECPNEPSTSCDESSEHEKEKEADRNQNEDEETRRPRKLDKQSPRSLRKNDRTEKEEEGDQDAIDRYYENNQYTVTGHYQKNQETLNRIPNNYLKVLKENTSKASRDSREPSHYSVRSKKSNASLPIPGANHNRFVTSFYWLAHHNKKIGFRHMMMILLMVLYTLLGATIFYNIESGPEHQTMEDNIASLEDRIRVMALEVKAIVETNNTVFTETEGVAEFIKGAYIQLLQLEGRYVNSAYYKAEDVDNHMMWTFGSAFFFSTNVYTTVGYGSIAPSTILGKSMVMLYGFIFVPLTLVVVRDLGQWALVVLTKIYARTLIHWRKAHGYHTEDDEDISLPIKFCLGLLATYLGLMSVFVWVYDASAGPQGSGIDYFHSLYFSFITTTTIGLGDIMPNNVTFSPIICMLFFLGMPIIKVVNRVTYIAVENGVFGTMTVIENRLENSKMGLQVKPADPETGTGAVSQSGEAIPSPRSFRSISNATRVRLPSDAASIALSEEEQANEFLNNFTVRSIATFMKARSDVYGGDFGRVRINKAQLEDS